jgi:hypothetical protein
MRRADSSAARVMDKQGDDENGQRQDVAGKHRRGTGKWRITNLDLRQLGCYKGQKLCAAALNERQRRCGKCVDGNERGLSMQAGSNVQGRYSRQGQRSGREWDVCRRSCNGGEAKRAGWTKRRAKKRSRKGVQPVSVTSSERLLWDAGARKNGGWFLSLSVSLSLFLCSATSETRRPAGEPGLVGSSLKRGCWSAALPNCPTTILIPS